MEKMTIKKNEDGNKTDMLRTENRDPRNWLRRTAAVAVLSVSLMFATALPQKAFAKTPNVVATSQRKDAGLVFRGKIINMTPVKIVYSNSMHNQNYGYILSGSDVLLKTGAELASDYPSSTYLIKSIGESMGGDVLGTIFGKSVRMDPNTTHAYRITMETNSNTKSITVLQRTNKSHSTLNKSEKESVITSEVKANIISETVQKGQKPRESTVVVDDKSTVETVGNTQTVTLFQQANGLGVSFSKTDKVTILPATSNQNAVWGYKLTVLINVNGTYKLVTIAQEVKDCTLIKKGGKVMVDMYGGKASVNPMPTQHPKSKSKVHVIPVAVHHKSYATVSE